MQMCEQTGSEIPSKDLTFLCVRVLNKDLETEYLS